MNLHPQLAADTLHLGDLPLCHVLLMKNSVFPWLILVPRHSSIVEITDLAEADRLQLMAETCRASNVLKARYSPDKINIGALGNMVPQLHMHVIARLKTDPAWPGAVWGSGHSAPYTPEKLAETAQTLKHAFGF